MSRARRRPEAGSAPSTPADQQHQQHARDGEPDRGEGERREGVERALGDAEVEAPDEAPRPACRDRPSTGGGGPGAVDGACGGARTYGHRIASPSLYRAHVSVPDPQLLHRRPHRPRQVHAGRPADRGHRHAGEARRCGSRCSTPWTSSASAGITIKLNAVRMTLHRAGRRELRAQPDRHAGPRGLHLRGVALAGRVRGRHPGRGRVAGHPGADAVQSLPRAWTPGSRSSRCSTRSTCPAPSRSGARRRSWT